MAVAFSSLRAGLADDGIALSQLKPCALHRRTCSDLQLLADADVIIASADGLFLVGVAVDSDSFVRDHIAACWRRWACQRSPDMSPLWRTDGDTPPSVIGAEESLPGATRG